VNSTWTSRWCCYVCARAGKRVASTVRIFSGIMGGGFAACDAHAKEAETAALAPLANPGGTIPGYTVTAHVVDTHEDGGPKLGRVLWTVRAKEATAPPQG